MQNMARTVGMDALEQKIEKAQSDVVKAKAKYDVALATLKDLMDKRDALKRDEIITAIMKSDKSYDQILRFIQPGFPIFITRVVPHLMPGRFLPVF
jgi:energy-converting hydrogenase A subunit M